MTVGPRPSSLAGFGMERRTLVGQPLGQVDARDELLHPPAPSGHYSSTETAYYGFNVPAESLNGEIYLWFHPVLRVMSASVYIWRGFHRSTLSCDYINHFHFLPYPEGDLDRLSIPELGLTITTLVPLQESVVELDDPDRGVSLSLRSVAVMPPGVRPGGHHFTQAVRTTGVLSLYGEHIEIDGWFSRDRSWSVERKETARTMPPYAWLAGVLDDTFAFHLLAYDSAASRPCWESRYVVPTDTLNWGYLWRDGGLFALRSADKATTYADDGISPSGYTLVLEDETGFTTELHGTVRARMPWQTWQNLNVHFCLTEWVCDRGTAWGDAQEIQQNDFVRTFTTHH